MDDKFLAFVCQFLTGIVQGQFLLLDGMRAAPPVADWYLDKGKERTGATAPVVHEVVPAVIGTDAYLGHIGTDFQPVLQAMHLDILLQQAVLRCGIQGRLMVLAQIGRYGRLTRLAHINQVGR